jgi:glucose/arabinose dehydrogenase
MALMLALIGACSGDDDADPPTTLEPPPVVGTTTTSSPPRTTGDLGATTAPPAPTTTLPDRPDLDAVAVTLTEIASNLDSPTGMAVCPDDPTLYVIEQPGRVRAVDRGGLRAEPVLDLADEVGSSGNEQGLLGIACAPGGEHLYLDYTDVDGDTRVVEWAWRDGAVDPASRRDVLFVDQPFRNHNGGDIRFGPEGALYVALGDGGSGGDPQGNGQDRGTLLGAILRIDAGRFGDAPYGIPEDNPFVGEPGARPEIWHYGLRNPWRFSFDRATGEMWIGDVGQDAWEEIDHAAAGEAGVNYGWNAREGAHDFAGGAPADARDPVYEYGRDLGEAVIGGFVYRGRAIPALRGAYVFADSAVGELQALEADGGRLVAVRSLGVDAGTVTSFGEDARGELYVLDRAGRVLRIDPA